MRLYFNRVIVIDNSLLFSRYAFIDIILCSHSDYRYHTLVLLLISIVVIHSSTILVPYLVSISGYASTILGIDIRVCTES